MNTAHMKWNLWESLESLFPCLTWRGRLGDVWWCQVRMWRSRYACVEVVSWGRRGPSSEGCQCCYGWDDGFLRGTVRKEKCCLWQYPEREDPCPERHRTTLGLKQEVKMYIQFYYYTVFSQASSWLKARDGNVGLSTILTQTEKHQQLLAGLPWKLMPVSPLRMNCNNFCDHLTFHLVPPSGQNSTLVDHQIPA